MDVEVTTLQVGLVDAGDFQLATIRGFYLLGDLDYVVVIEIQASHCIMGLGLEWFFLDGNGTLISIELNNAKTLRILDVVTEHGGTLADAGGIPQQRTKALAVEDVVTQHQADRIASNELLSNDEGLC
ncbi:hypothetical protein D9M68_915460 [compost metagenome]